MERLCDRSSTFRRRVHIPHTRRRRVVEGGNVRLSCGAIIMAAYRNNHDLFSRSLSLWSPGRRGNTRGGLVFIKSFNRGVDKTEGAPSSLYARALGVTVRMASITARCCSVSFENTGGRDHTLATLFDGCGTSKKPRIVCNSTTLCEASRSPR